MIKNINIYLLILHILCKWHISNNAFGIVRFGGLTNLYVYVIVHYERVQKRVHIGHINKHSV